MCLIIIHKNNATVLVSVIFIYSADVWLICTVALHNPSYSKDLCVQCSRGQHSIQHTTYRDYNMHQGQFKRVKYGHGCQE